MADSFASPSAFSNAATGLTFRLAELTGRKLRTSTFNGSSTLASMIVPLPGRIVDFRMRAIESGTTSSATFNTVQLVKLPVGVATATVLATLRTNRGSSTAASSTVLAGATQLVNPGDLLLILLKTKLNTASQIYANAVLNKELT